MEGDAVLSADRIRVTAAVRRGGVAIELTEPEEFVPGPEGRKSDAAIERDAETLWLALRDGLPAATLARLREHFRTWQP